MVAAAAAQASVLASTARRTVEWNWRSAGRWPMDSMVMPALTHSLHWAGRKRGW